MNVLKGIIILIFIVILILLIASCSVNRYAIRFENQACISPDKGYEYFTCDNLTAIIDDQIFIEVPKGFKTNLSSIPRPLWSLYAPQYSQFVAPAILHDYMYAIKGFWDRRYADDLFYSSLRTNGVSQFTSLSFWLSVRLFGWRHYLKDNHD